MRNPRCVILVVFDFSDVRARMRSNSCCRFELARMFSLLMSISLRTLQDVDDDEDTGPRGPRLPRAPERLLGDTFF